MWEEIRGILNFLKSQGYSTYQIVIIMMMSTFIFILLTLLKKPIKKLTSHINNTKVRKLANKSIILLAYALSIGGWYVLSKVAPNYFTFDTVEAVLTGSVPVVMYAVGDGVLTKSDASANIKRIEEIVSDGKVTNDELKEVTEITTKALDGEEEESTDPEPEDEDLEDKDEEDYEDEEDYDDEDDEEEDEDESIEDDITDSEAALDDLLDLYK